MGQLFQFPRSAALRGRDEMVSLLAAAHQQALDGRLEAVFIVVKRRDESHGFATAGRFNDQPREIVAPVLKCLTRLFRPSRARAKC